MNRNTILILPVLLVVGCKGGDTYTAKPAKKIEPAKVAAGEEAKLYPLTLGTQWVYATESGGRIDEMTVKVIGIRQEGGATVATLSTTLVNQTPQTVEVRMDSTGIYQTTAPKGGTYNPPQPLLTFPLETETKTYQMTGPLPVGDQSGPLKLTLKYIGPQEVDTDMGRMSALAVESVMSWTTPDGQAQTYAMSWWAPGIGFVRQRIETTMPQGSQVTLMKLKTYSPG